jgi:hypothetical protein
LLMIGRDAQLFYKVDTLHIQQLQLSTCQNELLL